MFKEGFVTPRFQFCDVALVHRAMTQGNRGFRIRGGGESRKSQHSHACHKAGVAAAHRFDCARELTINGSLHWGTRTISRIVTGGPGNSVH